MLCSRCTKKWTVGDGGAATNWCRFPFSSLWFCPFLPRPFRSHRTFRALSRSGTLRGALAGSICLSLALSVFLTVEMRLFYCTRMGLLCRMVTISPVVLFFFLAVTFCVGLKTHQSSQRGISSRRNSAVSGSGRRRSAGRGDAADIGSNTTEPSRIMRCLPRWACPTQWVPVFPQGLFEATERNEPDEGQVRVVASARAGKRKG